MPTESDWGKIGMGQHYGILAVDVDRALACAQLTVYEQVVMQYAREHCWGKATRTKGGKAKDWPEPLWIVWNLKRVAAETGMPPNRLSEAKNHLIRSHMLREQKGGSGAIQPNKDADRWVFPEGHHKAGEPRLNAAALAYAIAARNWQQTSPDTGDESTDVVPPTRNEDFAYAENHSAYAEREFRISGTAIPDTRNEIPPTRNAPYKERASEDLRLPEDQFLHTHGGRGASPPERKPEPIHSQPGRSAEDFEGIHEAARILSGDSRTDHLASRLMQEHNTPDLLPLEGWRWVMAANVQVSSKVEHSKKMSWGYFCKIARSLTEAERDRDSEPPTPSTIPIAPRPATRAEARRAEFSADAFAKGLAGKLQEPPNGR